MKKNGILIELTPLLDVILIMLFLVLVQSQWRVDVQYEEGREAMETELALFKAQFEDEMARMRDATDQLESLVDGLESANAVVLGLVHDDEDFNQRWITIDSEGITERIFLPSDRYREGREQAILEFNAILAHIIQSTDGGATFIIFRYDSMNIFYIDRGLLRMQINIQRLHNPLVFFAEVDLRP